MYAVTIACSLVVTAVVSLVKVKLAGVPTVVLAVRLKVTPGSASVTWLLLDVTAIPSTFNNAFAANCVEVEKSSPLILGRLDGFTVRSVTLVFGVLLVALTEFPVAEPVLKPDKAPE